MPEELKPKIAKIFYIMACEECDHCKSTWGLLFRNEQGWCVQSEKYIPDIGKIAEFCELEDAEENNKLRAKWFEKGQMSMKRKNKSGCCCIIDDNDEVVSVCGAHKTWMEEQCQKN